MAYLVPTSVTTIGGSWNCGYKKGISDVEISGKSKAATFSIEPCANEGGARDASGGKDCGGVDPLRGSRRRRGDNRIRLCHRRSPPGSTSNLFLDESLHWGDVDDFERIQLELPHLLVAPLRHLIENRKRGDVRCEGVPLRPQWPGKC